MQSYLLCVDSTEWRHAHRGVQAVHERNTVQNKLHDLEQELANAQQAHHYLELQKIENSKLKSTIDSLKFEIDQLGARARLASTSSASLTSVNRALRSLGSEMGSAGTSSEGEGGDDSDDGDKTEDEGSSRMRFPSTLPKPGRGARSERPNSNQPHVIMKIRNIIQRQAADDSGVGLNEDTIVEETLEMEDRATQTDAPQVADEEAQTEHPDPPPYDGKNIPLEHMAWNEWLVSLGVNSPYAGPLFHRIPPQYHHLMINGLSLLLAASTTSFVIGFMTGAYLFQPTYLQYNSDAAWLAFNTLSREDVHSYGWKASLGFWWSE
jgi:hypothetical protein